YFPRWRVGLQSFAGATNDNPSLALRAVMPLLALRVDGRDPNAIRSRQEETSWRRSGRRGVASSGSCSPCSGPGWPRPRPGRARVAALRCSGRSCAARTSSSRAGGSSAPGAKSAAECVEAASLSGKVYEEIALIGVGDEGLVCFWSFTSDGKRSQGTVADVTDVHAEAIGFEAEMPAGLARMVYWPDEDGGFFWVVESKNKKGWRRFVEHNYKPA